MPFIAPAIAAAIGVGIVGEALIGLGLAVAMGAAAHALTPKPKSDLDPSPLNLSLDPEHPREMVFGEALVPGSLVYAKSYGPKNIYHIQAIALADHPTDSLLGVYVDGEARAWNPVTGLVDGFNGNLHITFLNGTQTQAPTALVNAAAGEWLATDRYVNGSWALVQYSYDPKVFASASPPSIQFRLRGMKLYDPRKDSSVGGSGPHRWNDQATWEFSRNPALVWYLARRGYWVSGERIFGLRTPASLIPIADVMAEADACDAAVPLAAGGTVPRYRFDGVVQTTPGGTEAIRAVLAATAGREIDSGGIVRLRVGVARPVVAALTQDDLVADTPVKVTHKLPATALVNAVYGSYRDPSQMYASVALPPRVSLADEAIDGGRFERSYDLGYVTHQNQGQRVLEILRRQHRQQLTVELTLRRRWCGIEADDWVTITDPLFGWTNKVFRVVSVAAPDGITPTVSLMETAASVYDWTTADELSVTAPSNIGPGAPPSAALTLGSLTYTTITTPSGEQRPGLTLTWTPPADPTVDDIVIEYREVGTSGDPMVVTARAPESGTHTWITGVMGGAQYQARARATTTPVRDTPWTTWLTGTGTTAVTVSALALTVPPGAISPANLSAQAAFELALVTATDEALGSLSQLRTELDEQIAALSEASGAMALGMQRHVERLAAETGATRAEVRQELLVRATETEALAARIDTVATTVGENTASIQQTLASVDGMRSQWAVAIDNNGAITGLVRLSGDGQATNFDIVADRFRIAIPGAYGAEPQPVFAIGQVNGNTSAVIRGDLIADGGIAARHLSVVSLSAISGNLGEITTGRIESPDGSVLFDLNAKIFRMTA